MDISHDFSAGYQYGYSMGLFAQYNYFLSPKWSIGGKYVKADTSILKNELNTLFQGLAPEAILTQQFYSIGVRRYIKEYNFYWGGGLYSRQGTIKNPGISVIGTTIGEVDLTLKTMGAYIDLGFYVPMDPFMISIGGQI